MHKSKIEQINKQITYFHKILPITRVFSLTGKRIIGIGSISGETCVCGGGYIDFYLPEDEFFICTYKEELLCIAPAVEF